MLIIKQKMQTINLKLMIGANKEKILNQGYNKHVTF